MDPLISVTEITLICEELQAPTKQFTVGKEYPALMTSGFTLDSAELPGFQVRGRETGR